MIKQINVFSLKELIDENDITVIDVREDHEIEICSEKQFIHIKMNEIPNKTKELNKSLKYAIICHSGIRSNMVCEYMENQGFIVMNVSGGVDEWAIKINPSLKRY